MNYLDNLELDLVISFSDTPTYRFNDSIYHFPREKPIHVACWLLVVCVEAIILTVSIQEPIGYQLLDYVQKVLHQLRYLSVKSKLDYQEVLIGIMRWLLLGFDFLYTLFTLIFTYLQPPCTDLSAAYIS